MSELVFSDDRRIFHHNQMKFEQWVEDRIRTTKAAGGIVNPTKLELFHAALIEGEVSLQGSEVCVGVMMDASVEQPTCIGVPLFRGAKPMQWPSMTVGRGSS